jgi:hypothetical protein
MIDGGPSNTYEPHLKPRINKIREKRGLGTDVSLPVDVLLVSHVDDDHIKGILELSSELRDRKREDRPLSIRVRSLWHNSFDDLLNTTPDELKVAAQFGEAALNGKIPIKDDEELDVAKILASIPQGRTLRDDAKALNWKPNDKFRKKLIIATKAQKLISMDGGLKITVVGPLQPEVKALQKAHDKWLRTKKKKKGTAEAALAAFTDTSIPNLSSIVLLAEFNGKRMLLTGDARGDKILKGLELKKLLDKDGRMHVDVLKMPHHGSDRNMDVGFLKRITADHYVFSGNGEHGNPERETLDMLFKARGDHPFEIHLTYEINRIDEAREEDWIKEQGKEKARKKKKPKTKVRANWSDKKNSLRAFLDENPLESGQEISIVAKDKPHVINLFDPLGF